MLGFIAAISLVNLGVGYALAIYLGRQGIGPTASRWAIPVPSTSEEVDAVAGDDVLPEDLATAIGPPDVEKSLEIEQASLAQQASPTNQAIQAEQAPQPKPTPLAEQVVSKAPQAPLAQPAASEVSLEAVVPQAAETLLSQAESSVASLIREHEGGEPAAEKLAPAIAAAAAEMPPPSTGEQEVEIDAEMLAGIEAFRAQLAGIRETMDAE